MVNFYFLSYGLFVFVNIILTENYLYSDFLFIWHIIHLEMINPNDNVYGVVGKSSTFPNSMSTAY